MSKNYNNEEDEYPIMDTSLISTCCSAPPWGDTYDDGYNCITGICSQCHEHASFTEDIDENE